MTVRKFGLANLTFIITAFLTSIAVAQDTSSLRVSVGGQFMVHDGRAEAYPSHMPFLFKSGNTLFCSIHQHADDYIMHPTDAMSISHDNGATWSIPVRKRDFYLSSLTNMADDSLIGVSYIAYYLDNRQARCHFWKSPDNGTTWTQDSGTVTFPADIKVIGTGWSSVMFYRGMMSMADGSLQGPMYGKYVGDAKYRCLWVKSMDRGANWSVVSTIAYDGVTGAEGFCEPDVVMCADSSLLCVMRVNSWESLYQCRSKDSGLTWSVPQKVHAVAAPGILESQTWSVAPALCLMSNGVLALVFGRPSNLLLFSKDGCGNSWDTVVALPQTVWPGEEGGYMGVCEASPNKLLVVGENRTMDAGWVGKVVWGNFVSVNEPFSSFNTFENDSSGLVPAGYSLTGLSAMVVNTLAYQSQHSLRIRDTSASVLSGIIKQSDSDSSKTFEAMFYPAAAPNGNMISINSGGNDNAHIVYHLAVFGDGSIKWYNGSVWNPLGDAGTVSFNAWNKIRIQARATSGADVFVNDTLVGQAGFFNAFPTMDRVRFGSGSTIGIGDDFYVDNVLFERFNEGSTALRHAERQPVKRPDMLVSSGRVEYFLPADGLARIDIYSIDGKRIQTLATGFHSRGRHEVIWRRGDHEPAAGLYLFQLTWGNDKLVRKTVICR
ncbi:MAG: sialidase family protein [Fibrobacterota bacterium]